LLAGTRFFLVNLFLEGDMARCRVLILLSMKPV
jgi:hypothetical protein